MTPISPDQYETCCFTCGACLIKPWVGLTDEEIAEGVKQSWVTEQAFQSAVWWAEAKLREKNT
jgi:Fe-S oxidoreductase